MLVVRWGSVLRTLGVGIAAQSNNSNYNNNENAERKDDQKKIGKLGSRQANYRRKFLDWGRSGVKRRRWWWQRDCGGEMDVGKMAMQFCAAR